MPKKSVMIIYNQEITEEVFDILEKLAIRGFTKWEQVQGRGSHEGPPHMGSHTWPELNGALLTVVREEQVEPLFQELEKLHASARQQGVKAYVWHVEQSFEGD